jgi:hypothetical protein
MKYILNISGSRIVEERSEQVNTGDLYIMA